MSSAPAPTGSPSTSMDNHYVPNLTIGPLVCEAIRPHARRAHRRASDGASGRPHRAGLREGGRESDQLSPGSVATTSTARCR